MYCQKCGLQYDGGICPRCGNDPSIPLPQAQPQQAQQPQQTVVVNTTSPKGVRCPRCGSDNLQAISDVQGNGIKLWKLCLCGLFGLCGAGKTKTEHYWACSNCGYKFKM